MDRNLIKSCRQGCDASVLVNSTANNTAEKDAIPNLSLAGFDTHVQERYLVMIFWPCLLGTRLPSRPPQPGQQPALQLHRKRRRRPFPEPNIRCFLKKPKCKILNDAATTVEIDPGSSQNFDTAYFAILKQREGIFQSDAALLTNRTPNKIVGELLNSNVFFRQFAQPMKRMGAIGVLPGTSGEIRKKCIVINS
ncbi:hypothetical protein POTOM_047001 [Populus tomentosa]|uniref:peroxidase n=1 Tax=Populus tomentosa TaxID=118781 RepID=A0A8X7YFD2_POPTO|nr:hypothetical protein POTOM_047001 [Populus tomentosa]